LNYGERHAELRDACDLFWKRQMARIEHAKPTGTCSVHDVHYAPRNPAPSGNWTTIPACMSYTSKARRFAAMALAAPRYRGPPQQPRMERPLAW
jgi:hypothetical protein